ncbi:DUF1727 domain-containing protein [Canibacter sp. lx-45]|uniref:MurT ligase domain-containing protein n=1 Tax=Canibacter zhuwentaonis TaxID=2837491 RepID=UPI001BDC3C46|nr:MurT ligase domain-containing protein [Canibacter zhuwentaonis]MBT1035703.1 DUF1727 domain-containing protein [Canibacter zhuwentaonis]
MALKPALGVLVSKSSKIALQLLKRKGTHYPGKLAKLVDSQIIKNIEKPEKRIAVMGTNGKTTTTNLIADFMKHKNISYGSNRLGSNTYYGIATSLIDNLSITGKNKKEFAVLEIDELWAARILSEFEPTTITITNLFQDSYERNANIFYVFNRLQAGIPDSAKLILNANDPISSTIKPENERVYFAVNNIFNEEERKSRINDFTYCLDCHEKIVWEFNRYHHIGEYRCEKSGFTTPKAKYLVKAYDAVKNEIIIEEAGIQYVLPVIEPIIEVVYNQIAMYATLREHGRTYEEIYSVMVKTKVDKSRFDSKNVKGRKITRIVAKGYNPVANSRVFDTISKSNDKKMIVYLFDNLEMGNYLQERTPGWISDIDFDVLKDGKTKIVFKSVVAADFLIPLQLAGVDRENIKIAESEAEIAKYVTDETSIYVLHDIEDINRAQAERVINLIAEHINKEG